MIAAPRSQGEDAGVQSIVMALEILEYLAREPDPVGVAAIAAALGITKSRVYRHLRTLLKRGYIYQAGSFEKYRIGSAQDATMQTPPPAAFNQPPVTIPPSPEETLGTRVLPLSQRR